MSNTILGIIASSGGAAAVPSSYESIATATGTGLSTTITFSSIPSTYKHLQLRWNARDVFSAVNTPINFALVINGDTGTNYAHHELIGNSTSASAANNIGYNNGFFRNAAVAGTGVANMMGVGIADFIDYASTTKYKTIRAFTGYDTNNTITDNIELQSNLWTSTSAMTSFTLTSNGTAFSTDSTFALYGIKG
jgi:hypothetical protein